MVDADLGDVTCDAGGILRLSDQVDEGQVPRRNPTLNVRKSVCAVKLKLVHLGLPNPEPRQASYAVGTSQK